MEVEVEIEVEKEEKEEVNLFNTLAEPWYFSGTGVFYCNFDEWQNILV